MYREKDKRGGTTERGVICRGRDNVGQDKRRAIINGRIISGR
jgi:hypothetical protein